MSHISNLFAVYADVFGGDLLRYILGAGGTYVVLNVLLARRLFRQRIRSTELPRGQIRREIIASLRTVMIFAACGTCIAFGAKAGILNIYQEVGEYGFAYFVCSVVLLIVLHDAWFYWTHRVLHYPPLFRRFHRLHHRSHQPTPFTSYSFDIGEAVVNGVYLPLVLLVLPAHPVALFIFVTHMILRNAIGHSGIEVFPADRNGKPLFGWLSSVTHHDLHHAHAGYNLGLYFTWWDRLMGTEHPSYHEAFGRVAPRLSNAWTRIVLLVLLIGIGTIATRADASPLKGSYASPGLGVIVTFEQCRGSKKEICGRLLWIWDTADTPYAKVGDVIVKNLVFDGAHWQGRLVDPGSGRTYRGTLTIRSRDHIELKGCAGIICDKQTWHSIDYLRRILGR